MCIYTCMSMYIYIYISVISNPPNRPWGRSCAVAWDLLRGHEGHGVPPSIQGISSKSPRKVLGKS